MDNKNNSGKDNSGHNNSGSYNSGSYNSGNYNSGKDNSGHYNSGGCNSGDSNSGNCNSGHYNSGSCNSGHYNSGGCNSGSFNSGWHNSGNWNSGFFNTDTPTVRCFNKETGIKREDFKFPNMDGFQLTEYKNGKLVTYDYKEAWKNFWNSISEDRKSQFANLPNFDSKIFEEITGIKVFINNTTEQQIEELEKKSKELLEQIAHLKQTLKH